jgi:hypothetical protein
MGKVVKEVGGAQGQANLTLPGLSGPGMGMRGRMSSASVLSAPAKISDAASVPLAWLLHALFSSGACCPAHWAGVETVTRQLGL